MNKRLLVFLVMIGALLTMIAYTSGPIGAADTATPGASGSAASGSATSGSAAAPTATRAATPAATVAPTATVAATATRTGSVVATGTGGATVPSTLPTTGQQHSGSLNVVLIEVLLLALACVGAGIALRQRSKRV